MNNRTATANNNTLLTRIAAGDERAVAECIDKYGNLIWALARKLTPRAEDAEDAVQEIFMEIWQNAARYDAAKASESTFITLIARRRLIDRLRKIYRRPQGVSLEEYVETAPNVLEAEIAGRLEAEKAVAAMRGLRREQREMMVLNIYGGLSHGEISERLRMPLGTVKTHIRRGFQQVRETLGRSEFGRRAVAAA